MSALHQWNYVVTHLNPADLATRSVEASNLKESMWLTGPKFLYNSDPTASNHNGKTTAEILQGDLKVRKDVKVFTTHVETCTTLIGSKHFSRFSKWSKPQGAIAKLINVALTERLASRMISPLLNCITKRRLSSSGVRSMNPSEKTSSVSSVSQSFPRPAS